MRPKSTRRKRSGLVLAAAELDRRVRAFNPFPGVQATVGGLPCKVWQARPATGQGLRERCWRLIATECWSLVATELC